MPLPADVGATTGSGSVWSDWGPNRHGPFANGTDLYAVTVDRGATKVRVYRSTDDGRTWTEADAANAPASSGSTNVRCVDALAWGTDLWVANALSTSSMNLLRFSMSSNTWQTAVAGPTITLTLVAPVRLFLTRVTNTTDFFCLSYNGALETVMSTGYQRVKVHQYNVTAATWSGPYDAQGSADSPAANTLPGTQVDHYAASSVAGAGARTHLFWATGATGSLRHRIFAAGSAPAFGGASTALGADAPTDFCVGAACAYAGGAGGTGVAVPYGVSTGYKVARCADSTTAATAGNWTTQTVTPVPPKRAIAGQPGALCAQGARLFAWEITDGGQEIRWADDGGAGAWPGDVEAWKQGADALCPGLSAMPLAAGGAVGVLYGDELGPPALQQTGADAEYPVGAVATSGYYRAQSFRFAAARTLAAARLLARKVGTPAIPMACQVCADAAGAPGTVLSTAVGFYTVAQIPTSLFWMTWRFSPAVALTANTTYWINFGTGAAASGTSYYVCAGTVADAYADGTRSDGTNASVWTADGAGGDLAFALYAAEDGGERVRYDRLVTLRSTAAQAAGTTTGAAVDLGEAGPNDATVLLSVGDAGDPAGTVEVVVEHSDDGAAWAEATRGLSEGASLRDVVALTGVGRYLRLVSTVTGADTPDVGTVAV